MITKFPKKIVGSILNFIAFFTGKIAWSSPPWVKSLLKFKTSSPLKFYSYFIFLILLISGASYGIHWYIHLPPPLYVQANIQIPSINPPEDEQKPESPLTISFTKENKDISAAPISLVGKKVTEGIAISPTMNGSWKWENDHTLVFQPTTTWLAGQEYSIELEKSALAKQVKMENYTLKFSTTEFQAKINELKLYQDIQNGEEQKIVATLEFNYPVDPKNLKDNLQLVMQKMTNDQLDLSGKHYTFSLRFTKQNRVVYLTSEAIALNDSSRYMLLVLNKGIKAESHTSATPEQITQKVLIPDNNSMLTISSLNSIIVHDLKNKPQQVLLVNSSIGVEPNSLIGKIHAYLLPADKPAHGSTKAIANYGWENVGEVTPEIIALSKNIAIKALPADHPSPTTNSFSYKAEGNRYLYITIDKNVEGEGHYLLKNNYFTIVKTPEYPKEISFLYPGSLIALGSDHKLSTMIRGIPEVKFTLARVLPTEINHLITQTSGDFSNPHFTNYNFNQKDISELFSEVKKFNIEDAAEVQYTALDLDKYLAENTKNPKPIGLFLITAQNWNSEKNTEDNSDADNSDYNYNADDDSSSNDDSNIKTSRLILITDLGLVIKRNFDGTYDGFIESISSGTPVADARFAVLGRNGLPISTQTTDKNGHVTFPSLKDFKEEQKPTVFVAYKDNDVSFMPFEMNDRQLNYSKFDVGGLYLDENNQQNLNAFLFSDRGIYRPGDTAHVGMIVKSGYVHAQPQGLPLEIIITDSSGTTVLDEKLTLNVTGFMTTDYTPPDTAPTGTYTASLYVVKDQEDPAKNMLLGSTDLRVEEFLPDTMKISNHFNKDLSKGWITPDNLKVDISLMNLFGTPAENRKVTGKIVLTPRAFYFDSFNSYSFVDPLLDPKKEQQTFNEALPDLTTNNKGEAEFDLDLNRFDKATYQLIFYGQGFAAEGGRSVYTQRSALVSPLDYLIGYKADTDMNFIKQDEKHSVNLIAINNKLEKISISKLTAELFRIENVATLVKNEDDTYSYQSLEQEIPVTKTALDLPVSGLDFSLPTDNVGNFIYKFYDNQGVTQTKFKFSVIGDSTTAVQKNAELTVKLNKNSFSAGDDIELQITGPYAGAGLITIERDKVYAYQWFKAETVNSVQKIHIPEGFEGDGYVNVALVRDLNSAEIFMSPLTYSITPFSVNRAKHAVSISLNAPKLAKPGDVLSIEYATNQPSKIVVYAVDEGILQVADYQTPDPLSFYFQKHALQVDTTQILDQILPKFIASRELSSIGGDEAKKALNRNINPFKRKTDLPVAYWSGIIDADSTPRTVQYTIPDYFNGTLRVMAVAVSEDAVGALAKESTVRGDLILTPNAPTFVAPGDVFDLSVNVSNNVEHSGNNFPVKLVAQASANLTLLDPATKTLSIDEGKEKVAHFQVKATSDLGSAEVKFIASNEQNHVSVPSHITLSVRPALPYQLHLSNGYEASSQKTSSINLNFYSQYRTLSANISKSPLILLNGIQQYLDVFPYGCTEQLVSKGFSALMADDLDVKNDKGETAKDKINAILQELLSRQQSDGGFAYWPGVITDTFGNNFSSVYAIHFLFEAKNNNVSINSDLLTRGLDHLREYSSKDPSDFNDARLHAYAIYLLTLNEEVTTNYLTNLQLYLDANFKEQWRTDITSSLMAATYQLLKNEDQAKQLIKTYAFNSPSQIYQWNDFFESVSTDALYLYLLENHFPDLIKKTGGKQMLSLVNKVSNYNLDTLDSAYSLLALKSYAKIFPDIASTGLAITEVDQHGKQTKLPVFSDTSQNVAFSAAAKDLIFSSQDDGFFYQTSLAGFEKTLPTQIENHGIEIYHEYTNEKGKVIKQAKLGEELTVHLKIRSLDNNYYEHLAIVDLAPAGFDIVAKSVEANYTFYDVREDRVVVYAAASPEVSEITYKIKATNQGKFITPPAFAENLYNQTIYSRGLAGTMEVN